MLTPLNHRLVFPPLLGVEQAPERAPVRFLPFPALLILVRIPFTLPFRVSRGGTPGYGTSDETGSYSYSYVSVEVLADGTEVERHAYMRQASHHSSTTSSDGRHPGRPHLHRGKGDRERHPRSAHGKRLSSSVTKVDLGPLHLDTNEEFADDREARRRRRADRQRLKVGSVVLRAVDLWRDVGWRDAA